VCCFLHKIGVCLIFAQDQFPLIKQDTYRESKCLRTILSTKGVQNIVRGDKWHGTIIDELNFAANLPMPDFCAAREFPF
jgi:hypothetical protein